jgi:hypothetical protein
MKTEKKIDAVRMMREIRAKHHREYEADPELREKRLLEIRKQYSNKIKNPAGQDSCLPTGRYNPRIKS